MGNVLHYLKWRGDLSLSERPFNEADNLALSLLAYTDLHGIVKDSASDDSISIQESAILFLADEKNRELSKHGTDEVLYAMALSERFRNARLLHYVNETDEKTGLHFSAVTILPDDETVYVAFRGTGGKIDDWREDFRISFEQTPAQSQAIRYLQDALRIPAKQYMIGGHSKGGNLALHAALHCEAEERRKITAVYSNDGPGICPEFIDPETFGEIRNRYFHFIPEFSVVGMLFHEGITSIIVKSSETGIMQHNGMTWQVDGDRLKRGTQLTEESSNYNMIFDRWIESADLASREQFTGEFFDALKSGGALEMDDVAGSGIDGFGTILVSMAESESRTKLVLLKFLSSIIEQIRQISFRQAAKERSTVTGAVLALLGLFFITLPEDSYKVAGGMLALCLFVWAGRNVLKSGMRENDPQKKRGSMLIHMLIMSLMVLVLASMNRFTFLTNLMVGTTFLLIGFQLFRTAIRGTGNRFFRTACVVFAILALAVGLAGLATPASIGYEKALSSGSFLLLSGVVMILYQIVHSGRKRKAQISDENTRIVMEIHEKWECRCHAEDENSMTPVIYTEG